MPIIVHVISAFDVFGPEKTTINECKWLAARGWKCLIVNIWEEINIPIKEKIEASGIEYICLLTSAKLEIKIIKKLRKILIDENVNIVHTHGYKSDAYTSLAAIKTGIITVTTVHGWTSENLKVKLYERLQAFVWRFYDKVYAVSQGYCTTAIQRGVPEKKIDLLYNGIIVKEVKNSSVPMNKSTNLTGEINIGIVGRLSIEKSHDFYLKVALAVSKKRENIIFNIIGDGPERSNLVALQKEYNLENNVKFWGHIDDMEKAYQHIDIMTICSLREGLPNVLLEAMLNKIPVVSMDVGGVPEVIRQQLEGGYIIYERNISDFADTILMLSDDENLRRNVGQSGYDRVLSHFTFEKRMRHIIEDYNSMLSI